MRIVVVGMGYVGMASAVLLAQRHDVCAVDIDQSRVQAIRDRRSPIADPDIEDFLNTKHLRLSATADILEVLPGADFVVVEPTDVDGIADLIDRLCASSLRKDMGARNRAAVGRHSPEQVAYEMRRIYQRAFAAPSVGQSLPRSVSDDA